MESDRAPSEAVDRDALKEKVIEVLKTCYDPEIPVDIYELGLIYTIDIEDDASCRIDMTLTSPACPVAGSLPPEVEQKIADLAARAKTNKIRPEELEGGSFTITNGGVYGSLLPATDDHFADVVETAPGTQPGRAAAGRFAQPS